MTIEELHQYFKTHNYSTYERKNYDKFLEHMNFSFPIKSVHITGTNGKGSTANFLFNIYKKQGLKVGLYHSPYLINVTESILIDDKNISEEEYLSLFESYQKEFDKFHLSSFEIQTFLAYQYFIKNNLDLVIVEVGMGGFIDATNIITPILSIITNVSLEHTAYLGTSISEIAYNKAGIIKENVPVLTGKLEETAEYAIREYAKDMGSQVYVVDDFHNEKIEDGKVNFYYRPYNNLIINTNAIYQCLNASLAIEATKIVSSILPVEESSIREGLKASILPARFEYLSKNLIVDGGHNPAAISQLCESIQKAEERPIHVIFASFRDKNIETMLISLSNIAQDLTLTTFDHVRARKEEEYFLYLDDYHFESDYKKAITDKLNEYPDDVILVTGSLAFAGLVRNEFKK